MGKVKLNKKDCSRSHRFSPYSSSSDHPKSHNKNQHKIRCKRASGKEDLEDITCSVCMEFPHNAVLLLCSSHDKGCRPFMCATGYRYSNCLEQYKKANTKVISSKSVPVFEGLSDDPCFTVECRDGKSEVAELLCPLCRGQVKGWTVVAPIRKYLNSKKRACMQDNCSFVGSYKGLKKHVKATHPRTRPRDVDPVLSEKWKKLENDREVEDVYSTIRSAMPGAIVVGDYVIERNFHGFSRHYDSSDDDSSDDDLAVELGDYVYSSATIDNDDVFGPAPTRGWGSFGRFQYHRSSTRVPHTQSLLGRSRGPHRRVTG